MMITAVLLVLLLKVYIFLLSIKRMLAQSLWD
jgi:hypothetical protein